ncbi:MAG: hypothetical protein ABMA26_04280 [Limisphaerales bacterium]
MSALNQMLDFKEALSGIAVTSATAWLYLPAAETWNLNSKCALLESDEVPPEKEDEPDAGIPEFAKQNHLKQALPVTVVQDIVTNVMAQKVDATPDDYFRALEYYYKHDAFMNLAIEN